MSFDRALQFVLAWEGGYVSHPRDPGGATNLGITHRTLSDYRARNPEWGLPGDVRNLTRPQAARIYRAGYWDPVKGDELPSGIALLVFDAAVNHGPARAIRWLQEAVGVRADGVIGPATLAAVRESTSAVIVREFATLRALGYVATGNMATFGKGWMRRLFAAVQEASR